MHVSQCEHFKRLRSCFLLWSLDLKRSALTPRFIILCQGLSCQWGHRRHTEPSCSWMYNTRITSTKHHFRDCAHLSWISQAPRCRITWPGRKLASSLHAAATIQVTDQELVISNGRCNTMLGQSGAPYSNIQKCVLLWQITHTPVVLPNHTTYSVTSLVCCTITRSDWGNAWKYQTKTFRILTRQWLLTIW